MPAHPSAPTTAATHGSSSPLGLTPTWVAHGSSSPLGTPRVVCLAQERPFEMTPARPAAAAPSRSLARQDSLGSRLRAALIRANACRFSDRYSVSAKAVGEGAFGRVHCCVDNLAQSKRAVKRIPLPADESRRLALRSEVDALVMLDHPHIVRLIEYFSEGSELLLVMELLEGPSLRERMNSQGCFGEELAARCVRHILKALFCCHCQGIAHNDVSADNFKFLTNAPDASLKMVDFGLSKRCAALQKPPTEIDHSGFAQERDIWAAGAISFEMLTGCELYPQVGSGSPSVQIACATDLTYIPSRIQDLKVSPEARDLLSRMLEPTSLRRVAAREALMHPFIIRTYPRNNGKSQDGGKFGLECCVVALRSFHQAARLKRLALLIVAHLLTTNDETLDDINWLFRFLVRDGHRVEEETMRTRMQEASIEVPDDFDEIFNTADIAGKGGLDYVEFVAACIINEPKIFCRDLMLSAVFRFLDAEDTGIITDAIVQKLFDLPVYASIVREACGCQQMNFASFRELMVPPGWLAELARSRRPAPWAELPDYSHDPGSGKVETTQRIFSKPENSSASGSGFNPVQSSASESFAVCQKPGFHKLALCPFYNMQPVSNVVLGIARGTSSYARDAVRLGLAEIVEVGSQQNGVFFFMPNPKYHWTPGDAEITEDPRLRFVAWWIHPDFVNELRTWVAGVRGAHNVSDQTAREVNAVGEKGDIGEPGDFGYSDVVKPQGYLHTYRDLMGMVHVEMLEALVAGVGGFLERILGGEALPAARLSVGFHYPVRPQYSTLHLQLRVNSGEVCGGKEGRGVDLFQLLSQLRADSATFSRDEATLHYKASMNLRSTVLAAASLAGRKVQECGPQALVLTPFALPL